MSAPDSTPPLSPESPPPGTRPPSPEELQQLQFPEDIRTRWGWGDILIFIAVSLGIYFALGISAVIIAVATGHSVQELQTSVRDKALFAVVATAVGSFAQLGFFYIYIRRPAGRGFWWAMGWRSLRGVEQGARFSPVIYVIGGCIFALAIGLVSKFVGEPHGMPIEMFMHDRLNASLFLILGVTVAPLIEETMFRGFLYPVAARTFGIAGSIVFTGFLFGLMHAPQLGGAWIQTGLLMIVGIVFTFVRAKSRSVLGSYLFHLGYNGWLFIAFLAGTHLLKNLPQ